MAVLRIPQVDTEALRDVVRDLSRDLDTSRLTALREDLGHLDLHPADDLRRELGRLDLPSADDLRRELGRLDLPSAGDVRRELGRLDLPSAGDVRRELGRLDLPSPGDVRRELQRFERDLPDIGRFIGRPRRRALFVLPTITPTVVLGSAALLAGAALGGVLAWLYQPGAGPQRRKALRRRLHKLQRSIQHSR
jgi:hypothetical protein